MKMEFTECERESLKKATHLLDNGWEPIFNAPEETRYSLLKPPNGILTFGRLENLLFDDAVTIQKCIEKIKS